MSAAGRMSQHAGLTARGGLATPVPRPRVATWLTARERAQVDAAAGGPLDFDHRSSLAGVREALERGADAALVSAALVSPGDGAGLAGLVRGFPAVPVAGLVTAGVGDAQALAAAHLFGAAGVGALCDARSAAGWTALRGTFTPRHLADAFLRACVAGVLADLRAGAAGEPPGGLVRFFTLAFAPDVASAKQLAARLGVHPCTLTRRFMRAGLPSPKRYVAFAQLVRAARLGETPALSISAVAHRLGASSPQSFHRTVRTLTGLPARTFRERFTGATMLGV